MPARRRSGCRTVRGLLPTRGGAAAALALLLAACAPGGDASGALPDRRPDAPADRAPDAGEAASEALCQRLDTRVVADIIGTPVSREPVPTARNEPRCIIHFVLDDAQRDVRVRAPRPEDVGGASGEAAFERLAGVADAPGAAWEVTPLDGVGDRAVAMREARVPLLRVIALRGERVVRVDSAALPAAVLGEVAAYALEELPDRSDPAGAG